MEFHTEREEALYTTLTQVLHNHVTTHQLAYAHTLGACIPVLGYLLYVMIESWDEAPPLIATTLDEIQQRVQTRALQTLPARPAFADYAARPMSSAQYQELGTALATLITTSGLEYDLSVVATWRAYLALMADLLAMPLQAQAQHPEAAEAYIASLHENLLAVMHLWAEEQS
jgi:hypothetical protein